mmetsp:Transcript_16329/g.26434  ORF Transcript_16329/g.26434 Transcript_16329/m.26434 type:complete len:210 (+) Transcript_16329:160-789(+)
MRPPAKLRSRPTSAAWHIISRSSNQHPPASDIERSRGTTIARERDRTLARHPGCVDCCAAQYPLQQHHQALPTARKHHLSSAREAPRAFIASCCSAQCAMAKSRSSGSPLANELARTPRIDLAPPPLYRLRGSISKGEIFWPVPSQHRQIRLPKKWDKSQSQSQEPAGAQSQSQCCQSQLRVHERQRQRQQRPSTPGPPPTMPLNLQGW